MENEKDKPLNVYSENDSVEVNDLISLAETEVPEDVIAQLQQKAEEEQEKLDIQHEETLQPQEIEINSGIELADGSISVSSEITEHTQESAENDNNIKNSIDMLEEAKMNATYRKYVIYIDKENEEYIDKLSLKERKELINDILKTQNNITKKQREDKLRAERISKILLGVAVFMVAIPVFYFVFNVCLEATIQNYRHSRSNFEVLYKETGKIKINQK